LYSILCSSADAEELSDGGVEMSGKVLPELLERAREIAYETVAGDSRAKMTATGVREGQLWINWIFGADGVARPEGSPSRPLVSAIHFAVADGINRSYGIARGDAPELADVRSRRNSIS
jgi:hypothetical protein